MEALRQDDPRRFGTYTALTRFRETAAAVQYLAHGTDPDGLVVVTAARPELAALPAFRRRFHAEARTAERLAGGWVEARSDRSADDSGDEDLLWTASAYVPALTLAEAVDLSGPLPERAVRILGAGIAETLSRVHATGAVLQGLSPRTVLLAADGPRLTAFGPLGAAAAAEARPGGQLSVRLGYLTPEQVAGQEAGPASDLFVLGLLLAYAATGSTPLADGPAAEAAERIAHTDPRLDAVPGTLRELVARCLAKDPADRPTAGTVAAELALEGAAGLAKGAGCRGCSLPPWPSRGPGPGRRRSPRPPTAPQPWRASPAYRTPSPPRRPGTRRGTPRPRPLPTLTPGPRSWGSSTIRPPGRTGRRPSSPCRPNCRRHPRRFPARAGRPGCPPHLRRRCPGPCPALRSPRPPRPPRHPPDAGPSTAGPC